MVPVILASGSPRRKELLQQMGLTFTIITPDVDENIDAPSPDALVQLLSQRKAAAIASAHPDAVVIAADTVVCLRGQILGKPQNTADAQRMLQQLSGQTHTVHTGFTVQRGNTLRTSAVCTAVHFRSLSPEEITRYIATGEPMDKAGAYAIQGIGGLLVTGLEGDYYNVIGLPICPLGQILQEFGVTVL